MKWCLVISSGEPETIYNALRLANTALKHGTEVSVFMLGAAVDYQELSSEQFDLVAQVEQVQEQGDFYV
jgi:uncharacterized protein involved in oxidation of intracellular sulfur